MTDPTATHRMEPLFDGLVPRSFPLLEAVRNVMSRAEHRDAPIVAWTEHGA